MQICPPSQRRAQHPLIDEIHRFNKTQQDAFLPYVESGATILIALPRKPLL
jgi:putative ATPase